MKLYDKSEVFKLFYSPLWTF